MDPDALVLKKRKRGPYKTAEEKKRVKHEEYLRRKARRVTFDHKDVVQRWRNLQKERGIDEDHDLAKFLLDRYIYLNALT